MVKKVAIIGPESTGKSTLSQRLAEHYNTLWVPEYAREYLTVHGMNYTYDSLLDIAKGQVALEENILGQVEGLHSAAALSGVDLQNPLVIADTEMYVMKVWCEFVFRKCHHWIIDQITAHSYDLYLLCNIDLPWNPDPLREYPTTEPREQLFRMYHDIVENQSAPWTIISGEAPEQRLQSAIIAINKIL
jgi:NadR type nicotinamide-nucleotide adenylyltransferase